MKLNLIIILSVFTLISCNDEKQSLAELSSRISELEKNNRNLLDSISKIERKKLVSSSYFVIPENEVIKANEKNKLWVYLHDTQQYPSYQVYRLDSTFQNNRRELIYENMTNSYFSYEYIPKSTSDSLLWLMIEFDLGNNENEKIQLSGGNSFKIK